MMGVCYSLRWTPTRMANQSDVEAALEDELQYRILLTKQILCNEAIDADSPDDMEGNNAFLF